MALLVALVSASALVGLYLARRIIAREALLNWLDARGVLADVDIERFEINGFTGRVRIGPAGSPDFTADRVEAAYELRGFWTGRRFGVDVVAVRLVRPVMKARVHGDVLSFGAVDPLLEELRKHPLDPEAPKPLILIETGRLFLETDYGGIGLRGDGRIEGGRLVRLTTRLDPARVARGDAAALIDGGRLDMVAKGDQIDFSTAMLLAEAQAGTATAHRAVLRLSGAVPYPDLEKKRGDGGLFLNGDLTADSLDLDGQRLQGVKASGAFEGRATGWIDTLALTGPFRAKLAAEKAVSGDLTLTDVDAGAAGQAQWSRSDWRMQATASGDARGAWTGLGPASSRDSPEMVALKRAAEGFTLQAPAVSVSAATKDLRVGLEGPVTLIADAGGKAVVAARGNAPIFQDDGGAVGLAAGGGGLPNVTVVVDRYTVRPDGLDAQLAASVDGSFGPVQDGIFSTAGAARLRGGGLTYAARGCAPIKAAGLDLGDNDLRAIEGKLCPDRAPLLTLSKAGWTARGRIQGLAAQAPSFEVRVEEAAGVFRAKGEGARMSAEAKVERVRILDTAKAERFRPLGAMGTASLVGNKLTGLFSVSDASSRKLADATLSHDMASGVGGVQIDTGEQVFQPDGLQPVGLSPLASAVASPVTGRVRFQGGYKWAGKTSSSGGTLNIATLDFKSPAGTVTGLSGDLVFTSLTPVRTAPGQTLRARQIDSLAVLTDMKTEFQLDGDLLRVAAAEASTGGGRLLLEPMTARLTGGAFEGVVDLEAVQLKEMVERSPFADHVSLDARVKGRLPFVMSPEGIRFINGRLEAIQPGRLSISREALSGVKAEGGAAATPQVAAPAETNTVTEFAYQALENLAFDSLSAEVNSLPKGRLGVLFKIKGEHAPPKEQELRLSLFDLFKRDILKRKLPLPSHTKVDLTLDTSVNLDQILADFAETQRARGSGGVQP